LDCNYTTISSYPIFPTPWSDCWQ